MIGPTAHERLTELFAEAVALAPDARAALLTRLRGADASLADELASLLAADAAADPALRTGGLAAGDPSIAPITAGRGDDRSRAPGLDATIGLAPQAVAGAPTLQDAARAASSRAEPRIAGYRVLGVLGEGGMGVVYAAEQQAPRRRVAIKVLHARSPSALARFRTEAEIMARLDHPGIARVLEAGDADGHPYLAMEHVDGVTLDRHVAALPRRRRLELFTALCDAVHHAHVHGVIHRDLKPSNVMVRPDGRVAVLDFGVARLAASESASSGETRAGELIGTPLYMSPEQARLRPHEVDARSDVYTLGVMLYELLTGELPYPLRDLPLLAVFAAICDDAPVPLGRRDRSLAGDLEAIADRALRKPATERYQSVAALADDVRRVLAGAAVSVRTPGASEQLVRFCRRRPLLAGGIAATVLAVAAFAIVVTELWLAAARAERRTEAARAELEVRTAQLTVRQARAAMVRDPTESLAWLATLTASPSALRAVDPGAVWSIAEEALGRGVASRVLVGHTGEVHWVEAIPGTTDFVSGAYDGRAIVWHGPDASPREVFRASRGRVRMARPAPDGAQIAIGADGGTLAIVDRDGAQLTALSGHRGDVQSIAWSPDGAWLATGDNRGAVWLWPRARAPGRRLRDGAAAVSALEFSADGAAVLAADHTGALWLWPTARPDSAPTAAQAGDDVVDAWTDGQQVIAVDAAGTVRTWRRSHGALALERELATGQPTKHAAFSTAGAAAGAAAWAVLGAVAGSAIRVDGSALETIATHRAQVRYIAISADGRQIATSGDDGTLQVTDRTTGRHLALRGHTARVRHVAFAGSALLSSDADGVVRRWELAAIPPTVLEGSGAPIDHLIASRDGTQLAAVDATGEVAVWTLGRPAPSDPVVGGRRVLGTLAGHASAIAVAGTAAAPIVITGTTEGDVALWLAVPVHRTVRGIVRALAVCGDRIAAGTSAGPIALFASSGEPVGELPGNTGGTEAIACDPDGGLLAAAGQDRMLHIYRLGAELAELAALGSPRGDLHFATFSPRGDLVVAAGNDGAVYAWPVTAGRDGGRHTIDPGAGTVLLRHAGGVTGLAYSFDGRWLATTGRDHVLRRRELAAGREESLALGYDAAPVAFDAAGAIRAITLAGGLIHVTPRGASPIVEHGARAAVAIYPDRLAVALGDGAIAIESLAPPPPDELARTIERATSHRIAR